MLDVSGLSFSYEDLGAGARPILDELRFSLAPGERVGLIGANGAGKSTLLKLLVGLLLPPKAQTPAITFGGLSIEKKTLAEIRRRIGYVFQDSENQLFMPTVGADVSFAAESYGYTPGEVAARTEKALSLVKLEEQAETAVYRLSGGQKKLAAIAGVLTLSPELLLLDEPSASLDPKNRRNLLNILRNLPSALLLASHDLDFVYDCCDRVLVLHKGRLVADGPGETVLRDKALLESAELELPLRFQ